MAPTERTVTIILPTRRNIFIANMIHHFFRMCQLSCRHAITLWKFKRYVVFSGPDGCPADTRKTNRRFDLWQIQSADYPADTRKSIPDQEMWQSDLFAPRGGVRARLACDVFRAVEDPRLSTKSPFAHCRGALLGSDEWRHTVTSIFNHARKLPFCAIFWRSFVE
jgi:hypothetical protein